MDEHPYRSPLPQPPEPKVSWWRKFWHGDDGYRYAVILEPSQFRTIETELHGPYTKRQALNVMRVFVDHHPYGEARAYKLPPGSSWPPSTNFTPYRTHTLEAKLRGLAPASLGVTGTMR